MIGILGAGFGLYGYLPAILSNSTEKVLLPLRYKEKFHTRKELALYEQNIIWEKSEIEILANVESVILALNPEKQVFWVKECLKYDNIQYLILEKPLANTPEIAKNILYQLNQSNKKYRIAYTFCHTTWAKYLQKHLADIKLPYKISIEWHFKAHHYRHKIENWKQSHKLGGGAIRFYGIHIIAFFAFIGFDKGIESITQNFLADDFYAWEASFKNKDNSNAKISLNSCSEQEYFKISIKKKDLNEVLFLLKEPFEMDKFLNESNQDQRINIIADFYKSLDNKEIENNNNQFYTSVNDLWFEIEKINQAKISNE
jgi:predicted dehydrogenase